MKVIELTEVTEARHPDVVRGALQVAEAIYDWMKIEERKQLKRIQELREELAAAERIENAKR